MPAKRTSKKSRTSSPSTPSDRVALGATPPIPAALLPGVVTPDPVLPDGALLVPVLSADAVAGGASNGPARSGVAPLDEPKPAGPAPKAGPPGARDARLKGRGQRVDRTRFYAFRRS
ncbi:hypothetical protein AB0H28_12835 [Micromonospora sp. NPDC050980]|uniref:hypothetical protein n=1 Tax=Micromonospora sp. NPDC050980 TaxID=3155161 RepID=UPI0033CA6A7C